MAERELTDAEVQHILEAWEHEVRSFTRTRILELCETLLAKRKERDRLRERLAHTQESLRWLRSHAKGISDYETGIDDALDLLQPAPEVLEPAPEAKG